MSSLSDIRADICIYSRDLKFMCTCARIYISLHTLCNYSKNKHAYFVNPQNFVNI